MLRILALCLVLPPPVASAGPQGCDAESVADYYDRAAHYDVLWGVDNIHSGYYPHLESRTEIPLNFSQAAAVLTRRLLKLGDVSHTSRVLDLGCGKGLACKLVAELTGASCTGLDLSPRNIERAKAVAAAHPDLSLDFVVGSFTELPTELHGNFTHVLAQEALVYVHGKLPIALGEVAKALVPGGLALINDYLGADGEVSAATKKAVHDRLGFDTMLGHKAWRRLVDDSQLSLRYYEDTDRHMEHAYTQLAEAAKEHAFNSADGTPLAENYAKTAQAAKQHEIGKNIAVLALDRYRR